jgi:hypothetical protein
MSGFRVFQRRNHRKIYRAGQTKIQAYVSLKIDAYFCLMSFMTLLDAVDANRLSGVCIAGQASEKVEHKSRTNKHKLRTTHYQERQVIFGVLDKRGLTDRKRPLGSWCRMIFGIDTCHGL